MTCDEMNDGDDEMKEKKKKKKKNYNRMLFLENR